MRRHLTIVAVLGTLLIAAGCSDDATPTWGDGAPPTPSAQPSVSASVVLPPNTRSVCAQAARTSTKFSETYLADLKLQLDAATKGESAKRQAQRKISRDVQTYSAALTQMARRAADAALKRALTLMSREVKALKGDVTKINADKMSNLTATLDKACGRA